MSRQQPHVEEQLVYSQTEWEARARGVRADTLELCARELERHAGPRRLAFVARQGDSPEEALVDAIAIARLFRLAKDGHVTLEGEK